MSCDLCGHYESLTLIAAVFEDCALTATSQKLQLPEHFQRPDPAAVQTLRCWTPRARRKNPSQPLSLKRDEGKSKPCFLTHGGDSVLIATLFPHRKYRDRKDKDGQRLRFWSILHWLHAMFILMFFFYLRCTNGRSLVIHNNNYSYSYYYY